MRGRRWFVPGNRNNTPPLLNFINANNAMCHGIDGKSGD